MDTGQLPGDPEPGLVEVRDLSLDESFDDGLQGRGDYLGDLPGHPGERGGGTARSRTSPPSSDRPGPWTRTARATGTRPALRPVLHRGGHPLRQWPQVTVPQLHRWPIIWCSVISAFTSGISVTCRRMTLASAAPARSRSHPAQQDGSCRITDRDDHSAASSRPAALPAGPAFRPVFIRSDFGAALPGPSCDGGREEFFEFCLSLAARSATCA